MLPKYGVVEMNVGTPPWEPTCVLTPTTANVTMEATAENFEALFNIVKCDLTNVQSPLRKLKRRPSNTQYRKGTPGKREYFNAGRNQWQLCEKVTPVSPLSHSGALKRPTYKVLELSTSPKRKEGASSMVATGGRARGSRRTASRVLEWDDDKFDESVDYEGQYGAASEVATGGKARGSEDANDSGSSPPFGGRSGSE